MRSIRGGALALALAALVSGPVAAQSSEGEPTFWRALADTTLERLLDEARRGSFEVQAAEARVEGADASRLHAALDLVPAVTASAGYTRRRFASTAFPGAGPGALPDQNVWESGLHAAWEVDVFGRVRSGLRARDALLGAAEDDVTAAEIAIVGEVARTYFALRGAQDQLAVARRNAENQTRTLELTRSRLEAGRGTDLDVERARAQLELTRSAIPQLEAGIATAQYRIAVLVGRDPEAVARELEDERALPAFPADVPEVATDRVLRARPDLLSAEGAVGAGQALVRSAKADYLPRVDLVAGAGYTATAFDAIGNTGTFNYSVGPVVSWAAFDLGRVKARVDEARAFEMEARARRDQAVLRAREELRASAVRYRTERERLLHLEQAAQASERAAELAARRFEGGVSDFLQVLDAERTLLAAQNELARGRTAVAEAYVALYEARGGLWGAS